MQILKIEVTQQDQIFVENECSTHGYTLSQFFENLLNGYRKTEPKTQIVEDETQIFEDEKPKKRGRRKKGE